VGKKEKGSWVSVVDGVVFNMNINKDIIRRTRTIRRIFCGFILRGGLFLFYLMLFFILCYRTTLAQPHNTPPTQQHSQHYFIYGK